MKIYVYIDESGSIHKNSKTAYFAVGGYFTFFEEKNRILSNYKRINKHIKEERNISLNTEIKSYNMTDEDKKNIFTEMQNINAFCGCVKVFKKYSMKKEIVESNIFFNYAVKLLFKDSIMPLLDIKDNIMFIVSIDNRNISVGKLNDLETYLQTEFCLENYSFKVTYYDSASNYGIQLADLIVNTFYNSFKDKRIVKNVLPILKNDNFRISIFPGDQIRGRTDKILLTE